MSASPGAWILFGALLLVPPAAVVGVWLWARRLARRDGVPRFVARGGYWLASLGALVLALGVVRGALVSVGDVSGETLGPGQNARLLAEGISEATNWGALGFLITVVAALWLGVCSWKWRGAPRGR